MPGPTAYTRAYTPAEIASTPVASVPLSDIELHYNYLVRNIQELWCVINGSNSGNTVNGDALGNFSSSANLGLLPRLLLIEDNGKISDSAIIEVGTALGTTSDREVRFVLNTSGNYRSIKYDSALGVMRFVDQTGTRLRFEVGDPTSYNDAVNLGFLDNRFSFSNKSAGFTAQLADKGKVFVATTGTWTMAFAAAATLTSGWFCYLINSGSGTITLDPNSTETIDNVATIDIGPGQACMICGNATALFTMGRGAALATQAEQETATATDRAVSPGRQQFHPSACKGYVNFNGTGTIAIRRSYNVTSLTDNGVGDYTINWTTAFSDANYTVVGTQSNSAGGGSAAALAVNTTTAPTTSAVRIVCAVGTAGNSDPTYVNVAAFGDQ